ncbi:MAG TPA: phage protein GemA/Gp16 family protein [Thermoanaerobaculia bacterium]|nr:phage protein GemA/Gp16 family protein [Thermoanaerobaculia bacterium]
MISAAQKGLLHVAKAKLGLDDDAYRDLLKAEAGVTSSVDLDNAGLNRVLKRFTKLGFINTAHRPLRSKRPDAGALRTEDQMALIAKLYRDLGWATDAQQMAFNKKCCGKSWPQTRSDATKVIVGLERYIAWRCKHPAFDVR